MTAVISPKISTNVRNSVRLFAARTPLVLLDELSESLAARLAIRMFLRPPRHAFPAMEQQWLQQAQHGQLHTAGLPIAEWNGQAMRTYRWGRADKGRVVLMHGWGGRATQMGYFIAPLLAAGYEVHAIDAPGHGLSTGQQSSVLHFWHALERLVASIGPTDAVIAHSLGGGATTLAVSAGLSVGKVVLISPSADLHAYAKEFTSLLRLPDRLRLAMQRQLETRLGLLWDDVNAIQAATRAKLPALVIHDEDDKEVGVAIGRAIANGWRGAEWLATQGLGHRRILKSEQTILAALRFIAGDGS
ncbi:alpha/beta hydrolase [Parachitinimonas caeni]|uniref:Alpha/beta hydrolase n=1 Tax=Parachitinimonas caeni TaxID=3031301 RepID=A0ABT7E1I6_9NEIS|nr:alpha/beta hydrolase [Parachitinimonas caeni]MDK2126161.1 alpha/beta hydrolase [Parachitinimonas caeni]